MSIYLVRWLRDFWRWVRAFPGSSTSQEALAEETKVGWGPCCFCGELIEVQGPDPCWVTVTTQQKSIQDGQNLWQVWVCHGKCFRERITKHSDIDLSPAHF